MRRVMTNSQNLVLLSKFDEMFKRWNERKSGERTGLHGSGIIVPKGEFCYREQVMNINFRASNHRTLPVNVLRIFLNGWHVHIKWQQLFVDEGVADCVEKTHFVKDLNLYFTPDAIITLSNIRYIVEIKSMNSNQFKTLNTPPLNAVRQSQLYMHYSGVPRAIVLVENKDSNAFKNWVIDYDPSLARTYVVRLQNIKFLNNKFKKTGKLPAKTCDFEDCKRAQSCPHQKTCFASRKKRDEYKIEKTS